MVEGNGELGRIGRQLSYLTEMVESELLSKIVKIQRDIFSNSTEQKLVIALLLAREPLSLSKIALECDTTGYAVRPGGNLRKILETMEKDGLVRNLGTGDKPRYELNRADETVHFLVKAFSPLATSQRRTRSSDAIFS
jgi:hypothetical protein